MQDRQKPHRGKLHYTAIDRHGQLVRVEDGRVTRPLNRPAHWGVALGDTYVVKSPHVGLRDDGPHLHVAGPNGRLGPPRGPALARDGVPAVSAGGTYAAAYTSDGWLAWIDLVVGHHRRLLPLQPAAPWAGVAINDVTEEVVFADNGALHTVDPTAPDPAATRRVLLPAGKATVFYGATGHARFVHQLADRSAANGPALLVVVANPRHHGVRHRARAAWSTADHRVVLLDRRAEADGPRDLARRPLLQVDPATREPATWTVPDSEGQTLPEWIRRSPTTPVPDHPSLWARLAGRRGSSPAPTGPMDVLQSLEHAARASDADLLDALASQHDAVLEQHLRDWYSDRRLFGFEGRLRRTTCRQLAQQRGDTETLAWMDERARRRADDARSEAAAWASWRHQGDRPVDMSARHHAVGALRAAREGWRAPRDDAERIELLCYLVDHAIRSGDRDGAMATLVEATALAEVNEQARVWHGVIRPAGESPLHMLRVRLEEAAARFVDSHDAALARAIELVDTWLHAT